MDAAAKRATLPHLPWPALVAGSGVTIAEHGRRSAGTGQVPELAVTDDGALLAQGDADAVVELGDELIAVGNEHVEHSPDEWARLAAVASGAAIAQTNVPGSTAAARFLAEIGRIRARQGRLDDWSQEIAVLRQEQRRKRRRVAIRAGLAPLSDAPGFPTTAQAEEGR